LKEDPQTGIPQESSAYQQYACRYHTLVLGGKLGVVDLPPSIKIGVSLILVQGTEYLSKLSLPAISTLVAGRLHTADSGSPEIFSFYLSAQSVRQAI
jgi:hypothetical protein